MFVDDQRLEALSGIDLDISYLIEDLCVIASDGVKDGITQCSSRRYARKMSIQKDVLSCRMDVRDAMSSGGLSKSWSWSWSWSSRSTQCARDVHLSNKVADDDQWPFLFAGIKQIYISKY